MIIRPKRKRSIYDEVANTNELNTIINENENENTEFLKNYQNSIFQPEVRDAEIEECPFDDECPFDAEFVEILNMSDDELEEQEEEIMKDLDTIPNK